MTVTGVSPPCDYTLFKIVVDNWSFGTWVLGGLALSALSAGLDDRPYRRRVGRPVDEAMTEAQAGELIRAVWNVAVPIYALFALYLLRTLFGR